MSFYVESSYQMPPLVNVFLNGKLTLMKSNSRLIVCTFYRNVQGRKVLMVKLEVADKVEVGPSMAPSICFASVSGSW